MNFTIPTALILQALEQGAHYGYDIMDRSGLPSGTVYPALRRLEQEGMISSKWEDASEAAQDGRPPRRLYELCDFGAEHLAESRKRFRFIAKPSKVRKPGASHA